MSIYQQILIFPVIFIVLLLLVFLAKNIVQHEVVRSIEEKAVMSLKIAPFFLIVALSITFFEEKQLTDVLQTYPGSSFESSDFWNNKKIWRYFSSSREKYIVSFYEDLAMAKGWEFERVTSSSKEFIIHVKSRKYKLKVWTDRFVEGRQWIEFEKLQRQTVIDDPLPYDSDSSITSDPI